MQDIQTTIETSNVWSAEVIHLVFQPTIHRHWCVLIVLLCGVIKTLYDIYSLMLVGRVERIFTRVGGTQLQSLAHPPGGGAWSASYDEM